MSSPASLVTPAQRRLAWRLFLGLTLLYCATGRFFIDNIDGETMFVATRAMVQGRLWLEPELTYRLNMSPGVGDKQYSVHGVFMSVAGLPLYYLGAGLAHFLPDSLSRFVTRATWLLGPILYTAGTAAVLFLLLIELGFSTRRSLFVTLAWALATLAFPYSKYSFSEPLSGLLHLSALWFGWRYWQRQRPGEAVGLGVMIGLALFTRHANALLIPIFAVLLVCAARRQGQRGARLLLPLLPALAGLLPGVLAWLWFNWARFGHVLSSGSETAELWITPKPNPFRAAFFLLFSPGKGLFLYVPLMLLASIGFYWLLKRLPALGYLLLSILLAHLAAYATWPYYPGDWCWGPRFLVDVLPLWLIPLAYVPYRGRWKAALWTFTGLSFAIQLMAVSLFYMRYFDKVEAAHGRVDWSYQKPLRTPLLGVPRTAAELRWYRLDRAHLLDPSAPGEDLKTEMRSTLDYWPVYAYRLGLPAAVWLLWGLLLAGALALLAGVCRSAIKPAAALTPPALP